MKNSIVKVQEAYNNNLKDYIKDIPNLFAFNQICVLSNGLETRLGAFNATYDFFFEWLKVDSEEEKVDREAIKKQGISIEYELKNDDYVTAYELDHSLLIYEILLPNTTWR